MNGAHLHLVVNHLPIVGIIIGLLVLTIGLILKKEEIKQTGLGIQIFSAITSALAFFTGEEAEEVIEDFAGVSETLIHAHEEAAEVFFPLTIALGILSLVTLFLSIKKRKEAKIGYLVTLVFSIVCLYFGKVTGTTGGEIRHPEIRTSETTKAPGQNLDDDHDDD